MEKQITGGKIFFRKPNIAEKLIMFGEMGYGQEDLNNLQNENENNSPKALIFAGKIIQKFGDFVEKVEVEINGKKINSYNDALECEELFNELSELAVEILGQGGVPEEKKPESNE